MFWLLEMSDKLRPNFRFKKIKYVLLKIQYVSRINQNNTVLDSTRLPHKKWIQDAPRYILYIYDYIYNIHIYDCLPKCLFLVWMLNRNSLRAASCLVFKTMTYLNSLKPCILSFMFEAVAKTCSKC